MRDTRFERDGEVRAGLVCGSALNVDIEKKVLRDLGLTRERKHWVK